MLSTVWLACVPGPHGCGALEPSTHRCPSSHRSQAVLPKVEVNLPAGQRSHDCFRAVAPNVPGKHNAGSDEPVGHDVPAGQTMH